MKTHIPWRNLIPTAFLGIALTTAQSPSGPSPTSLTKARTLGKQRSIYINQALPSNTAVIPKPNLERFHRDISLILERHCFRCHGAEKQKGSFRVDNLDPNLSHGQDTDWWVEVMNAISNDEMPSEDEERMTDQERTQVIDWLSSEIQIASQIRRSERSHSSFRRMTRYEFNYTLQDLLGLPYDFANDLPPEAHSEHGFQNSSELLHLTSIQFGTYRNLARQALERATVRGTQPAPMYWGISMRDAYDREWGKHGAQIERLKERFKNNPEKLAQEIQRLERRRQSRPRGTHYKNLSNGNAARASWSYGRARYAWDFTRERPEFPASFDHVAIIPPKQRLIVELGDQVPERGTLRIRIRASQTSTDPEIAPSIQLEFGWQASNNSAASVRISKQDIPIEAPPDQPQIYEWHVPLSEIQPRNLVRNVKKLGDLPSPSEFIKIVNSSVSHGDIQLDFVEVTAPVYPQWPPQSHTRLFVDSPNSANETIYAREILENFMPKAWRRVITDQELDQKLALFAKLRPHARDFQEAIIEVLATVVASPKFLYLARSESTKGSAYELSDTDLATRLSMFLWSSAPDPELRELAAQGKLQNTSTLLQQTRRLLDDSRSQRLSKHFVHQWLGMELLDYLKVEREFYPDFDSSLREAMQSEPIAFFQELLKENRSILDFLHSEDTLVNERLAQHYGLAGVHGNQFRRIELNPKDHRGGLMTQAGLLAMNSDGKDSHPLKRGIWMLERLLNDPPPPPPAAVPEIDLTDPDILKLTLKERIENHRDDAACRSCHVKIDPWGIAFENYDAVGRWRNQINDKPVDASSRLFNQQELKGITGLKHFLLENRQDQFCRAFVHKLMTYALGRPLTFADRAGIDEITQRLRKKGDRLGDLISLIVTSQLFRSN